MQDWTKSNDPMIVDVRTRAEYSGGHVAGSVNIPLQELPEKINELMDTETLVFCCASGGRSGMATQMLAENGHKNVFNGGSWLSVNHVINNK